MLSRVLRREHHEGERERVGRVVERDLCLVHGLEQARLGLGSRAVDLVGQHDVGEERTRLEDELALGGLPDAHADDVGRQHVRGELDALEADADGAGERGGQRRLPHAGDVLDQEVPAREEAHHGQSHHFRLPHESAADVFFEAVNQVQRAGHVCPIYTEARTPKSQPRTTATTTFQMTRLRMAWPSTRVGCKPSATLGSDLTCQESLQDQ